MLFVAVARPLSGRKEAPSGESPPGENPWPEVHTIEAELRALLADPAFAPRKNLLQWISEKLERLKVPKGTRLMQWLWWLVMAWCVLSLLFLLGHIIYTAAILMKSRKNSSRSTPAFQSFGRSYPRSLGELLTEMKRLSEGGAFREATGVMMLALLRSLHVSKLIRFHPSKSNGDYIREYPGTGPGRDEFRRFALAFDELVYSGAHCDAAAYAGMEARFTSVLNHVQQAS